MSRGILPLSLALFLALSLTPALPSRAAGVLYAAPGGMTSGSCNTWSNACALQFALATAASGDEIWVKAGVYYPGAAGNRSATFTLKNGVALYGGFAGTETRRHPPHKANNKTQNAGRNSGSSPPVGHNSSTAEPPGEPPRQALARRRPVVPRPRRPNTRAAAHTSRTHDRKAGAGRGPTRRFPSRLPSPPTRRSITHASRRPPLTRLVAAPTNQALASGSTRMWNCGYSGQCTQR
jgi:hypothetical protein